MSSLMKDHQAFAQLVEVFSLAARNEMIGNSIHHGEVSERIIRSFAIAAVILCDTMITLRQPPPAHLLKEGDPMSQPYHFVKTVTGGELALLLHCQVMELYSRKTHEVANGFYTQRGTEWDFYQAGELEAPDAPDAE